MFDGKNAKKIDYLEEERRKLWERITALEKKIDEKPSDVEKEAKQASKMASEYRNRTEIRLNEAANILKRLEAIYQDAASKYEDLNAKHAGASETTDELLATGNAMSVVLSRLNDFLESHPDLTEEIESVEAYAASVEENASKAASTYKGILTKKAEIDELHRDIIGYEDENEDGEVIEVEGLKDELESTYDTLREEAEKLSIRIEHTEQQSNAQYRDFLKNNKQELQELKETYTAEYTAINEKIESLLPSALTAGLSAAFIAKKEEEEILHTKYQRSFNRGIYMLIGAAVLPIAVSIFFLFTGTGLPEVIERSPKVIFAFLPLYVPLIWTTISANKKVNLSKRLIEEYSHKQVLSMTIEGLSKQIENIEDSELSEELRIKLIRNFLRVTNENPGKLISNYQKSDNPILNILDQEKKTKSASTKVRKSKEKSEIIMKTAEDTTEADSGSPEEDE